MATIYKLFSFGPTGLVGPDGLEFNKDSQLILVSDGNVLTLASNDGWKTDKQTGETISVKKSFRPA